MTGATKVLMAAAQHARDYFDRKAHGRPNLGMYEVLTIGRDLQEALAAVDAEEARVNDETNLLQLEARR